MLRVQVLVFLAVVSGYARGDLHGPGDPFVNHHKKDFSLMPTVPAGLFRRATCSAGQYNNNGCQTCQAGYYCKGDDTKVQCGAGWYAPSGATACTACPLGTWTDQSGTTSASGCKNVQGGYKANASSAATAQVACGVGNYSPGMTDTCLACPAGHYCNAQTTTTPSPCVPGRYAPTTGYGQDCAWCPQGYFNNIYGATSCCQCCSGWYNDQTSQTHCFNCPGLGSSSQGSPPAATNKNQCTFNLVDYEATCTQASSASSCPPAQNTLIATGKTKRAGRMKSLCPNPVEKKCPVARSRAIVGRREDSGGVGNFGIDMEIGPYECLDVRSNLESCGGCVPEGETEGPDGGKDCTAIDHISAVKCIAGKCVVGTCRAGYQVSADKSSCIRSSKPKHRGQGAHRGYHDF